MGERSLLTNHARVLACISHDPGVRLRHIAAALDITERSVFSIVTDLTTAGHVLKDKDGRRNRYEVQAHLPLPGAMSRERSIGEVLEILSDSVTPMQGRAARENVTSRSVGETSTESA